eukprot:TRINITY_DN12982_c0_g1_i1.p1 TRINITY_DN12982_c0_g1~~TRINITY_DN12982_c0_g1_i1.p1  ORF type:complete len:129 (+),score=14.57 TRINITY_DN12982_c0_g1_i1:50-388(+)
MNQQQYGLGCHLKSEVCHQPCFSPFRTPIPCPFFMQPIITTSQPSSGTQVSKRRKLTTGLQKEQRKKGGKKSGGLTSFSKISFLSSLPPPIGEINQTTKGDKWNDQLVNIIG